MVRLRRRARRRFLAPLTVLLLALTVFPLGYNLVISLTDKAAINHHTTFIGLANYRDLLTSGQFWSSIRVTVVFTVSAVVLELVIGLTVAVALTRLARGSALLRSLFLLPMAAAPVTTLFNWRVMLDTSTGVVNYLLGVLHLPQPGWAGSASGALPTLVLVDVWQWTPFMLIILAGGLASVPSEIYEASAVDGAGSRQTFLYLTLPMLRPYIAVAVLFRTIDALKTFDSIQILTSGGPGSSTTTLNYLIFQEGISYLSFGKAAAGATILLVLAIVLARALLGSLRTRTSP